MAETADFIAIYNVLFYKLGSGYTGVDYFILIPFGIFEVVRNLFRESTSDFLLWVWRENSCHEPKHELITKKKNVFL